MISPFVSIAGKPQSKMITYTHCFDLKCKCKWQIPFQIQLGTERSLFVCNWPLNKVRRKSFSFISSSPTIFFAVGCYAILARTHSLTPNGKSISLGSCQAYPYPAVATPTPHFPRTSFRPPLAFLWPRAKMRQKFYEVRVKTLASPSWRCCRWWCHFSEIIWYNKIEWNECKGIWQINLHARRKMAHT